VPIPSRDGAAIGTIVLHTVAPREFDERILNVLSRAASLVAGAIENARLYEDAQERVAALTQLAGFGREVAAVGDRGALLDLAAQRIRPLISADLVLVYTTEGPAKRLVRAAADPSPPTSADEGELVAALLGGDAGSEDRVRDRLLRVLGFDGGSGTLDAVELLVDRENAGAIVAASIRPWPETTPELMRAAAQQVSLAAEKIRLIEHLTEENLARDLFDSLATGKPKPVGAKLEKAGLSDGRPRFMIRAEPIAADASWPDDAADLERSLRGVLPHLLCDFSSGALRALVPVDTAGVESVRPLLEALDDAGVLRGLAVGTSEARRGVDGLTLALQEAADAAKVAARLGNTEEAMLYRDTGAYRYLIGILDDGGPQDHLRVAIDVLAGYDDDRGSQLVATLDEYLSNARSVAATARVLFIHVNTLRQRLERIEQLTELSVADEDLLTLQLAVKLGRIRT
jgi:hypothetical protein